MNTNVHPNGAWPIRFYTPRDDGWGWFARYLRLYVRWDGDTCYRSSEFITTLDSATAGPCYTEWAAIGYWHNCWGKKVSEYPKIRECCQMTSEWVVA